MLETILDWLKESYPVIFLCTGVAAVVWVTARFYFRRFRKIEDIVDNLPCEKCKEEIQSVKNATVKMDSICEQLSEMARWIMKSDPAEIDILAPKLSPRKMTAAGLNLYTASGAKSILDENADGLIESLHVENPQTPLDVEDKAYMILAGKLSDPMFNPVKNFIYYQPEKLTVKGDDGDIQITLSLPLLVRLMSLDLRDRYLAQYPV